MPSLHPLPRAPPLSHTFLSPIHISFDSHSTQIKSFDSTSSSNNSQSHGPNHIYYRFCHVIVHSTYRIPSAINHPMVYVQLLFAHCHWLIGSAKYTINSDSGSLFVCQTQFATIAIVCQHTQRHIYRMPWQFLCFTRQVFRRRILRHSNRYRFAQKPIDNEFNASRCLLTVHELCITVAAASSVAATAAALYMAIYPFQLAHTH